MGSAADVQLFQRGGIIVELVRTPAAMREAQTLRHQVFCLERNVFASQPGQTVDRDEFDARSRHILLRRRQDGEVVATARVVAGLSENRADCLPMQRYCCPSLFRNLAMERVGEISRFAISKASRSEGSRSGMLLRLGLLQGILRASQEVGLTHWCALMAPSLLRLMRATGVHFAPLGPMVEAYGRRQPCIAAIDLTLAGGKRRRPDLYHMLAGDRFAPPDRIHPEETRLYSSRVARHASR